MPQVCASLYVMWKSFGKKKILHDTIDVMKRRTTVHIAVDVNSGVLPAFQHALSKNYFLKEFFKYAFYGFAIVILASSVFIINQGFASTTILYPDVCLGGWEQTHLAEGEPQFLRGERITEGTGARLPENASAQLFCSRFKGFIPENTHPREARLKVYIRTLHSEVAPPRADEVVPEQPTVIDAADTVSSVETEPAPLDDATGIEEGENTDTPLLNETVPLSDEDVPSGDSDIIPFESSETYPEEFSQEPVSWLNGIFPRVYAAEVPEVPTGEVAAEADQNPLSNDEPVLSSDSVRFEEEVKHATSSEEKTEEETIVPISAFDSEAEETDASSSSPESTLLDGASTTPDVAPDSPEPLETDLDSAPHASQEPLIEIAATFDGVTRTIVGRLSEADFESVEFDIPLSGDVTWETFQFLEISLSRLPTIADHGPLAVDGMSLTIIYEAQDGTGPWSDLSALDDETEEEIGDVVVLTDEVTDTGEVTYATTSTRHGRTVEQVSLDPSARHTCTVEPFRTVLTPGASATVSLLPSHEEKGTYRAIIGSLPHLLQVTFEDRSYEYLFEQSSVSPVLTVSAAQGIDPGDFTLTILFVKEETLLNPYSATVCQFNVVVADEFPYE